MSVATRPHPLSTQVGKPLVPRPCRCMKDEPAGDLRDMTCIYCGHQVGGVPLGAAGRVFRRRLQHPCTQAPASMSDPRDEDPEQDDPETTTGGWATAQ